MSTDLAYKILQQIEQVQQSLEQVPVIGADGLKGRLSALLDARGVNPNLIDWVRLKLLLDVTIEKKEERLTTILLL